MATSDLTPGPGGVRTPLVATAVVAVLLLAAGAPLHTEAAPLGVVSLELARDGAAVDAIASGWRQAGTLPYAAVVQVLDTLFPFVYGWLGVALARRGRWPWFLGGLVASAAFADVAIENPLLDWMLWRGGDDGLTAVSFAAVAWKFAALGAASVGLAVRRWL